MNRNILLLGLSMIILFFNSCKPVKTTLTFKNYIETDVTVNIESYTKKGKLMVNESASIEKGIRDKNTKKVTPTARVYVTKGYKGGNIKIKYYPTESNSRFTIEPIIVPDLKEELKRELPLTGLIMYDADDNKKRLIQLGTDLKLDSATILYRLVDIKPLLGSLIIGKLEHDTLKIKDYILLEKCDILIDKPTILQEATITEKSIISSLKLSVPVYGSLETNMSNSDLCLIKWDVSHYPFTSSINISSLIVSLDQSKRTSLINSLRLEPSDLDIYILKGFDVIESGIFSTTNGTKITTDGNAAIASVFTANAAYAFKSEDSKFYSIPNKVYNVKYEKWQSVSDLLQRLGNNGATLAPDGGNRSNIIIPLIAFDYLTKTN